MIVNLTINPTGRLDWCRSGTPVGADLRFRAVRRQRSATGQGRLLSPKRGKAGLPSAPEIARATRRLRLVPRADVRRALPKPPQPDPQRPLAPARDRRQGHNPIPIVARHYPSGFKRVDAAFKPKGQSAWSILSSDFNKQNTTQGRLRWDSLSDF